MLACGNGVRYGHFRLHQLLQIHSPQFIGAIVRGTVALCGRCGNALGNGTRCGRCGSEDLQELDRVHAGTWAVTDQRSVVGDWDNEASLLPMKPSKASMRDVRRESRSRRRSRPRHIPAWTVSRQSRTTLWRILGLLLLAIFVLYQSFPTFFSRLTGRPTSIFGDGTPQIIQVRNASIRQGGSVSTFAALAVVAVVGYFAIVVIVARSADRKGRSAVAWFFLAWFFPIISWIIVASMTPSSEAVAERDFRAGRAVQCPSCREIIKRDASICRHCGRKTHR
jgi:RNA polymerase subunit RPABC4/transcription elongation factor Spt4